MNRSRETQIKIKIRKNMLFTIQNEKNSEKQKEKKRIINERKKNLRIKEGNDRGQTKKKLNKLLRSFILLMCKRKQSWGKTRHK